MKKSLLFYPLLFITIIMYSQNQRNVLIYNITSTDCGPCSCMDSTFKNFVIPGYPKTVVVALHNHKSAFHQYIDSTAVDYFLPTAEIEPSCFPDGLGYDVDYTQIMTFLEDRYANEGQTPVNIEIISKNWNPETCRVDLEMRFTNDGNELTGNFRYNVIITEDKLLMGHATLNGCSTPTIPHPPYDMNYLNDAVTRYMVYNKDGDMLIESQWPSQHSIDLECDFNFDETWVAENCNVVVNVFREADSLYKAPVMQVVKELLISGSSTPEENSNKYGITNIYPNPASDFINVHFSLSSASECTFKIYNLNGAVVKTISSEKLTAGPYNIEINTEKLQAGSYIVELENTKRKSSKTIVIN